MLNELNIEHEQGMDWKENFILSERCFHFYIMTYGRCSFIANGQTHIAEKGDFVLLPHLSEFEVCGLPASLHQKYNFYFKASEALIDQLPMLQLGHIMIATPGIYDLSLEKFRPIWKEYNERLQYANLRAGSFLLETFSLWQRELDRGELAPASIYHIDHMKSYITAHYRNKITKEHLGDAIRRSPNYAAALFKKGTGQTISEYVHTMRMKTAIYMLSESLLTITEISEYLGYSDVSYFQRLFKRTFGKPASLYMQERRST